MPSPSATASTEPARSHDHSPRERCLAAALQLLQAVGPEALSFRAVARSAGMSPTAPYRHFADKEAMLAALAERGFELFEAALRAASPEGPHMMTLSRFNTMGCNYVRFAQENPDYYRLMFGRAIACHEDHEGLRVAQESAFNVLLNSIQLLQRLGDIGPGDARQLAAHVWALCHGYASLHIDNRVRLIDHETPWEQRFAQHVEWTMTGLAPRTEP